MPWQPPVPPNIRRRPRQRRYTPNPEEAGLAVAARLDIAKAPPESRVIPALLHAAAVVERETRELGRQLGLDRRTTAFLLSFTFVADRQRPSDIARWMGVSRPTVSRILEHAEQRGLAVREPEMYSDREVCVRLTVAGYALLATLHERLANLVEQPRARDLRRLADVTDALMWTARSDWCPFDAFEHVHTSSKWRSRRWFDITDEWDPADV